LVPVQVEGGIDTQILVIVAGMTAMVGLEWPLNRFKGFSGPPRAVQGGHAGIGLIEDGARKPLFAAAHESGIGPSRQLAELQTLGAIGA
jgi:hypothetical protein